MIPRLDPDAAIDPSAGAYLDALRRGGFRGRVLTRLGERVVRSTDNSLYQFLPTAAIEPSCHDDCELALRLLGDDAHEGVSLTARGGGTGTSAMSLTSGIVIDFVRMNAVLSVDPGARTARVQPGVTLAQLNRAARAHGLMFGPSVSTSDRATLGGMIATDSAGKGSAVYGKTSDHVLSLRAIFPGGECVDTSDIGENELERAIGAGGRLGELCRVADEIERTMRGEIERAFPKLPRRVSSYDLAGIRAPGQGFSLNRLLCGSEGTLAIVSEATLRLVPIPAHRALVAVSYPSFNDAVADAERLSGFTPHAIETMDGMVLDLARQDPLYRVVESSIAPGADALTLVEFAGDDERAVEEPARALGDTTPGAVVCADATVAEAFWALRSRSVGLLASLPGARRPAAFVEDAGVPRDRLPSFIHGFDEILEREGLRCGRFGHLDAGVIHIRPALDMTDEADAARVRRVSDAVAALAREHDGVLWGEHGKGVRGEYNAYYFGDRIDTAMRRVKGAADPGNRLNPGKIATPYDSEAVMLTVEATTRGERDRRVDAGVRERWSDPFVCNGNAVCHSDNADVVMCPSWKGTRDRRHSPKGRSDLMREWLRRLAIEDAAPESSSGGLLTRVLNRVRRGEDFSHEVKDAMDGCLACKACAGQCPVRVDVPSFRSRFLDAYHGRYARSPRDLALLRSERSAGAPAPRALMRLFGIVDPPRPAAKALRRQLAEPLDPASVREGDVVILPDRFSAVFHPEAVIALARLSRSLGKRTHVAPARESGKPLHVLGMLDRFKRVAELEARRLERFGRATLVGVDPAITLLYRDEYPKTLGREAARVLLPQEFLASVEPTKEPCAGGPAVLLPHCTERAMAPEATASWGEVFARFGLELEVRDAGCCGMAGMWGHLAENAEKSRGVFDLSWAKKLDGGVETLATGFSCRTQVERFTGKRLRHPLEALADAVVSSSP